MFTNLHANLQLVQLESYVFPYTKIEYFYENIFKYY